MAKLLYVTYEWNFTKTCSSVFFPELLKKYFDVELCMIKDDSNLDADKINNSDYDSVVFFQCEPDFSKFTCKNIIFVPMYDTFCFTPARIKALKNINLINFSKRLHKESLRYGIQSFYIQYYPEIKTDSITNENRNRVFFWQRQKWNPYSLLNVFPEDLSSLGIKYINLHSNEYKKENCREGNFKNAQIQKSSWFKNKEDLNKLLSETKYYYAPRDKEGIGFSFLDALEKGCVIICHKEGTMNEYIQNKKNGYIINFCRPGKIKFTDFDKIQKASIESVIEGRKRYEQAVPLMAEFIERVCRGERSSKLTDFKNFTGCLTVNFVRVWDKCMRILKLK